MSRPLQAGQGHEIDQPLLLRLRSCAGYLFDANLHPQDNIAYPLLPSTHPTQTHRQRSHEGPVAT